MTTLTDASVLTDLPPEVFRPLRRVEYHAMVERGLFDGTRVELLGGVLVEMSPQGDAHVRAIIRLTHQLVHAVGDRYEVGPQVPLAVDEISEPEPDFIVVPPGEADHAIPARAVLVVEVSVSSLRFDLGIKAARYAGAGYPEYWVVDCERQQVHVHTEPSADGWGSVAVVERGTLTATAAEDVSIDLDALFAD